jgi:PST family polysaccharide transporter
MTADPEVLADSEIARRASRGAATYVARTGISQAVQAVSALAVARILLPREYGLFALALTLVAAVQVFGDLGISFSLEVRRRITDSDLRIGLAVALTVAVIGGLIVSLVWPHLSLVRNAHTSTAKWMGPAMAATLLLVVPCFPSIIVMERELKFSRLGVIGVIQAVVLFGTQVVLLLSGVGLWSMVIARALGQVVATVLTVRASGRLFLPSFKGPVVRLVRDGIPYGASVWTATLTGTVTNLIVAAQLGARAFGLFAWCTILATPVSGALGAVRAVAAPTLAKMRRDDGKRYDESMSVVMRMMATTAAFSAACLIGLAQPTIHYVFGDRWLGATTAVQFCLAGTIATAMLTVWTSDANARQLRYLMFAAAVAGAVATLATIWPLSAVGGVGGASAATYCVGPIAAATVMAWAAPATAVGPLLAAMRLFLPLLGLSVVLGRLVHTPAEFVAACILTGLAGLTAFYFAEGELCRRILRVMRPPRTSPVAVEAPAVVKTPSGSAVGP